MTDSCFRPRAAACILLTLPIVACTTADPDLDRRAVRLPHGVYLNIEERHYPVTGTDEEEIRRSLRERGPRTSTGRRVVALFEWDMRSSWRWRSTSRGCAMEDVEITVSGQLVMPRWTTYAGTPPALRVSWEQFMEALQVHEQGHHEHVLRAVRELHRALMGLEVDRCSLMRARAEALHDRILERWKRVDLEYETATDHGRRQGAVWPPGG